MLSVAKQRIDEVLRSIRCVDDDASDADESSDDSYAQTSVAESCEGTVRRQWGRDSTTYTTHSPPRLSHATPHRTALQFDTTATPTHYPTPQTREERYSHLLHMLDATRAGHAGHSTPTTIRKQPPPPPQNPPSPAVTVSPSVRSPAPHDPEVEKKVAIRAAQERWGVPPQSSQVEVQRAEVPRKPRHAGRPRTTPTRSVASEQKERFFDSPTLVVSERRRDPRTHQQELQTPQIELYPVEEEDEDEEEDDLYTQSSATPQPCPYSATPLSVATEGFWVTPPRGGGGVVDRAKTGVARLTDTTGRDARRQALLREREKEDFLSKCTFAPQINTRASASSATGRHTAHSTSAGPTPPARKPQAATAPETSKPRVPVLSAGSRKIIATRGPALRERKAMEEDLGVSPTLATATTPETSKPRVPVLSAGSRKIIAARGPALRERKAPEVVDVEEDVGTFSPTLNERSRKLSSRNRVPIAERVPLTSLRSQVNGAVESEKGDNGLSRKAAPEHQATLGRPLQHRDNVPARGRAEKGKEKETPASAEWWAQAVSSQRTELWARV